MGSDFFWKIFLFSITFFIVFILHIPLSNLIERTLQIRFLMIVYGYLFGYVRLLKDLHHDEVFIEHNGIVVMENSRWLFSYEELIAIARTELGYGRVTLIDLW